jgi:hypothetical protein
VGARDEPDVCVKGLGDALEGTSGGLVAPCIIPTVRETHAQVVDACMLNGLCVHLPAKGNEEPTR